MYLRQVVYNGVMVRDSSDERPWGGFYCAVVPDSSVAWVLAGVVEVLLGRANPERHVRSIGVDL
jgi:hypothetical protein